MLYPEWAGYLAAFDAYLEARRNGEDDIAEQARLLMGYFASDLLGERGMTRRNPRAELRGHDLTEALKLLGLDV
jgi:hypothetical protein